MRQRDVLSLLRKWQRALALMDWKIGLRIVKAEEIPGKVGEVEYELELREATIYVNADEKDPEPIIVHELLHCWTRQIREARRADLVEEQALEAIGAAILNGRRK